MPVIRAFAEGKKIEFRNPPAQWIEGGILNFELDQEFRIKPEPREWVLYRNPDRHIEIHQGPEFPFERIKVREVL